MPGLLDAMSAGGMADWVAFAEAEPFGPRHDELRWGLLVSMLLNVNRGSKKAKLWKPEDVLPSLKEGMRRRQSPEEIQATMNTWALALGGGAD